MNLNYTLNKSNLQLKQLMFVDTYIAYTIIIYEYLADFWISKIQINRITALLFIIFYDIYNL